MKELLKGFNNEEVLFFIDFCYFEFLVKFVLEPLRSLSTTHIS